MPPHRPRPDADPLDPFPPLLSGRRPITQVPTYASILRPHYTGRPSTRLVVQPQDGREVESERTEHGPGANQAIQTGWDIDDVDPQDALDELQSRPGQPSSVYIAGSNGGVSQDHLSRMGREGQARLQAMRAAGLLGEASGSGSGQGSGSDGPGVGTGLEQSEPSEQNQELGRGSVLSPSSAHFPSSTPAFTTPASRLTPFFTMDELLGQNPVGIETQPDQSDQTAARETASPPPRSDPIPIPSSADITQPEPSPGATRATRTRPISSALSSEIEAARRTWQGGIEAAERLGYDPTSESRPRLVYGYDGPGNTSTDSAIPLRRRMIRNNLGSGSRSTSGVPIPASGEAPSAQEVELDEEDIQFWTSFATAPTPLAGTVRQPWYHDDTRESREPRLLDLARRVTRPFYSHPNLTGDIDLDEWSGAFGPATGSGSGSGPLRRGGNNRRRDSLQQRIDPGRESSTGAEEVMPLLSDISQGLEPTNMENLSIHQPIIVRTIDNSTRRHRSASDGSLPEKRSRLLKRRKVPNETTLPPSRPAYLSMTSLSPSTSLPDDFIKPTKKSFLQLSHSATGRCIIKFCDGPRVTETDDDACALRANRAIPVECGVFYYEVECLDAGMEGFMSVGWMLKSAGLQRLVGWDKGTWGWHADDGMSFNQSGSGDQFAEKWSTGDTVGCGVDFTSGRAFFTKNGKMMGHRFSKLDQGLHPAIGLRSRDEELCVNFSGPFRFDIEAYVREARDNAEMDVLNHVHETDQMCNLVDWDISPISGGDEDLETEESGPGPKSSMAKTPSGLSAKDRMTAAFVLDYLKHNGYTGVLESTRSEMARRSWITSLDPAETSSESKADEILAKINEILAKINEIRRLLAISNSPVPLDLIKEMMPTESALSHRMSIYQLVHLIQDAQRPRDEEGAGDGDGDGDEDMRIIAYGRKLHQESWDGRWGSEEIELIDEASGLLALGLDEEGKKKWSERRQRDTELLDSHLRKTHGLRVRSRLVEAIIQTRQVNMSLARQGTPTATFLSIRQSLGLASMTVAEAKAET